jgi:hypothetical protein
VNWKLFQLKYILSLVKLFIPKFLSGHPQRNVVRKTCQKGQTWSKIPCGPYQTIYKLAHILWQFMFLILFNSDNYYFIIIFHYYFLCIFFILFYDYNDILDNMAMYIYIWKVKLIVSNVVSENIATKWTCVTINRWYRF